MGQGGVKGGSREGQVYCYPKTVGMGDGKVKRDAREGRGKVEGGSGRSQVNWYVKNVGLGEKVLVFKATSSTPKFDDMDRGRVKGASRESRERVRGG